MKVAAIIPWRMQPSRQYAMELLTHWYSEHMPHAEVLLIDTDDHPFNLAACRNEGVRRAESHGYDVCVINDADTIPQLQPLQSAIEAAYETPYVHLPYTQYRSLRRGGTQEYLDGRSIEQCDYFEVPGACSGLFVTTPGTWWSHGGQDERFRGWGFEDAAWYTAHTTLLGAEPQRHTGCVFSLHHDSAVKEGPHYESNAALCFRYQQAGGDPSQMKELVFR
jgi:hypothetical protein